MNDVFMTLTISLRVRSAVLSADAITTGLGWVPTMMWSVGEAHRNPNGDSLGGIRDHSYATFNLFRKQRTWLSDALGECAEKISPHRAFLKHIRDQGGSTELFVGWFLERDGGDTLPHQLLLELGNLGLDLALDVYPEGA